MAIITLTTDWNKGDYYVGALKGKIFTKDPSITIVDITHQVQSFNIMQAAFILRNCWFEFPKGTIHLIAVNASLSSKRSLIVIEHEDHYFITSDNGIAGLIFSVKPEKVYKIEVSDSISTFQSLNSYVDIAFRIIQGEKVDKIGKQFSGFITQTVLRPVIDKNHLTGSVIYIDSFSNAISNISKDTFEKVGSGKPFEILIQSNHYRIDRLNETYADSPSGELLALFNSVGLLEIAINNGHASNLLNLNTNSAIWVKFYDEKPANNLKLTGN